MSRLPVDNSPLATKTGIPLYIDSQKKVSVLIMILIVAGPRDGSEDLRDRIVTIISVNLTFAQHDGRFGTLYRIA